MADTQHSYSLDKTSRFHYNERLIAEVEQHPSLWDTRSPKNRNQVTKNADWRRVAAALNSSDKEVQSRWKNLRDTFLRRLRDVEATATSGEQPTGVRWAYFNQMLFLKDVVDVRPMTFSATVLRRSRATREVLQQQQQQDPEGDSWDVVTVTNVEEPIICETIIDESNETAAEPSYASSPPDQVDLDECMTYEVQPARGPTPSPCASPAPSSAAAAAEDQSRKRKRPLDDWDHFLMSLKRHLQRIPDHLVGSAQMHLLQMAVTYGAGRTPQALMPLDSL